MLGVSALLGRLITEDDDRPPRGQPVAVISYDLWQRKFNGDPGVVGRPLQVGTRLLTIVGVTPREYRGLMVGLGLHVFVPLRMQPDLLPMGDVLDRVERDNHWLMTVGRVKPGVSFDRARTEVKVLSDQITRDPTAAGVGALSGSDCTRKSLRHDSTFCRPGKNFTLNFRGISFAPSERSRRE